jgi:hypothetical protein
MTSVPSACPFCNAELPALPAAPATAHTACPRCGEPVASDRFAVRPGPPPQSERFAVSAGPPPALPDTASLELGKRRTLRFLLAIMFSMAAAALVFALMTKQLRRDRDPKPRPEPPSAQEVARKHAPAEYLALGYLPRGCNVAVGADVAALDAAAVTQKLLANPGPEITAWLQDAMAVTGLAFAEIDHAIAGTELQNLPFHITTVIVTRQPYDPARLKAAVEHRKVSATTYRNGTLYRLGDMPRIPKLWCAAPRVLVYTTLPIDELERIPKQSSEADECLTPTARKALTERLNKASVLWAVGDLGPAKDLVGLLPFVANVPKEQARLLPMLSAFAIGMVPDEKGAKICGEFYTGDPAAVAELRKYFESISHDDAVKLRIETPPPAVRDPEAQWASVQWPDDSLLQVFRFAERKDAKPR